MSARSNLPFLYVIADDTSGTLTVFLKSEFQFFVLVQRIVERILITIDEIETILFFEWRDFSDNLVHG